MTTLQDVLNKKMGAHGAELVNMHPQQLEFHTRMPKTALAYRCLDILIQVTGLVLGILALMNYWDMETATKVLGGSFLGLASFAICSRLFISLSFNDLKKTKCEQVPLYETAYVIGLVVAAILTFIGTMPPDIGSWVLVASAGLYTYMCPCITIKCLNLHQAGDIARDHDAGRG